jgi:hypothetical protein
MQTANVGALRAQVFFVRFYREDANRGNVSTIPQFLQYSVKSSSIK